MFINSDMGDRFFDICDFSYKTKNESTLGVSMYENENKVVVKFEIPGVDKSKIDISVYNDVLTVSVRKNREVEPSGNKYYYDEITYGKMERSVLLPEGISNIKHTARYVNGVLTVILDKEYKRNKIIIE